jgi:2-polyprenyl-6-methoxyphenol hydroxylase-like FAD-dependent oxidoreductase
MMSDSDIPDKTQVCIIGAGPAGVIAAYLFALRGVSVVLLEGEKDFDREFRGDTLHASSLEILDQLGLADEILAQCNSKVVNLNLKASEYILEIADFSGMDSKFPFVAIIPQEKFLNYIAKEAEKLSGFTLYMGARVKELKRENEKITGVKFMKDGQEHELDCLLTIGADGRGSTVRRLADMKCSYKELRKQGIEHFRNEIAALVPEITSAISEITDWSQCSILSVVTGSVEKWYQDGLLLIGDAAHVMSPVGGVGINYAIQDAVATVNLLADPIKDNQLGVTNLAMVQSRREPATKFIQKFQMFVQKRIITSALKSDKPFSPPLLLKVISSLSFMKKRVATFLAYGRCPERVEGV